MSAGPFAPHLREGEHIVWSAEASADRLRAAQQRRQMIALGSGLFAAVIALLLAVRFFESVSGYATNDIAASLLVPLYGVFALAMAALAYGSFSRLAARPAIATHFAATSQRLIALLPDGSVAAELPAAEIDSVIAGGRASNPDIYVLRKDDPGDRHAFAIEHIDKPLEAKAIIEETFREYTPEPQA
jgi:hypothetical protein